MCGIIHVKRLDKKLANKTVLKRFEKQKNRGTEGFGFIEINDGIVGAEVRTCTEKEIKKKLAESKATEIMFHHRTPTSTPNFVEATHPILVRHKSLKYDYYVMHNGIITNDEEMRKKHLDSGFVYNTQITKKFITHKGTYKSMMWNDSEALAIDFCLSLENDIDMTAKGSIAMIALQLTKKKRKAVALYFCRNNGNPLKIEDKHELLALSSETGKEVGANILFRMDYATNEITQQDKKIGRYDVSYSSYPTGYGYTGYGDDYDGYPRPMPKESQAEAIESDFDMSVYEAMEELKERIREAERMGEYDIMSELQDELEEMELELEDDFPTRVNKTIDKIEEQRLIGF